MSAEIASLGLVEVARLIRARKLSSLEATKACLARIARLQPKLNAFIAVEADEALRQARALDRRLKTHGPVGPLHGVPLAHKDMFYRKGRISSAGSKIRRDFAAPFTSTVMARIEQAGAVCVGRLNMTEFAADATGYNAHHGACINPWNAAHITGGSSSGSGVATAARLVFGALGSDTGGSIRLPAGANGVVGLMPTYGRVSRYGAFPRCWSLDHIGPLARSARDCARMLGVIAGEDENDATSSRASVPNYESGLDMKLNGLRVGVPRRHFHETLSPEVAQAIEASRDTLKRLGARLVPVDMLEPLALFRFCDLIVRAESTAMQTSWLQTRPQDYAPHFLKRIEAGFTVPATWYVEALMHRPKVLQTFLDTTMAKVDVLHCPLMPRAVPRYAELDHASRDPSVTERMMELSYFTRPFNYLGVPTMSVPCGFSADGMPIAFQLVGRPFDEASIIRVAHAYQGATDWHIRAPAT